MVSKLALGLGLAIAVYLVFVAGLYSGLQPFGQKLLDRIAGPLIMIKRSLFGVDPLLVDYGAQSPAETLFDGAVNAEFEGLVLPNANLVKILPGDVIPREGAKNLKELLTHSVAREIGSHIRSYRVIPCGDDCFRHVFDLGWSQPEFLSHEKDLSGCVSVIVPGSGFDQSSQILKRIGYHEALIDQFPGTRLIYVRPNNDSRQIIFSGKRANFDYLYTTLVGINSSYSYWFIQELIAVVSYLRGEGKTVVIGGLSQGGGTALLVGAVSDATLTIVLSGYYDPSFGMLGNYHQIRVPGLWRFLQPDQLAPLFRGRGLILTYGKKDLPIYRYEAETQQLSRTMAAGIENFRSIVHEGGHTYPTDLLRNVTEMLDSLGHKNCVHKDIGRTAGQ